MRLFGVRPPAAALQRITLRNLCASAVNLSAKTIKPQRRRGRYWFSFKIRRRRSLISAQGSRKPEPRGHISRAFEP